MCRKADLNMDVKNRRPAAIKLRANVGLVDVASIVASLFGTECQVLAACSQFFNHDPIFLRSSMQCPGAPSRLLARLRNPRLGKHRFSELLGCSSRFVVNEKVISGKTLLEWCIDLHRTDLLGLILGNENVDRSHAFGYTLGQWEAVKPEHRPKLRGIAEVIASCIDVSPRPSKQAAASNLVLACRAGLPSLVEGMLKHPDFVASLLLPDEAMDGHTPFSAACTTIWEEEDPRGEYAPYRRCAELIARLPSCDPAQACRTDDQNLMFACFAGLSATVERWVKDPRVPAEVLHKRDEYHRTCFDYMSQCSTMPTDYQPFLTCLEALASHPACSPAGIVNDGCNALTIAAAAGAPRVLKKFLTDERCTAEVYRHGGDGSAFAVAVRDYMRHLRQADTDPARALHWMECAQLLAESPHFNPAERMGEGKRAFVRAAEACAVDIVRPCLADPRCTAEAIWDCSHALPLEVAGRVAADATMPPSLRARARECVALIAAHRSCQTFATSAARWGIVLHHASTSGVVDTTRGLMRMSEARNMALDPDSYMDAVFTTVCKKADDPTFTPEERRAFRECGRLIGPHERLDEAVDDETRVHDAVKARLPAVLTALVLHSSCTAAMLTICPPLYDYGSPFALACDGALDERFTAEERAASLQCARILALTGHIKPTDKSGPQGSQRSNLYLAAWAGLTEVITRWGQDSTCDKAALLEAMMEVAAANRKEQEDKEKKGKDGQKA